MEGKGSQDGGRDQAGEIQLETLHCSLIPFWNLEEQLALL